MSWCTDFSRIEMADRLKAGHQRVTFPEIFFCNGWKEK